MTILITKYKTEVHTEITGSEAIELAKNLMKKTGEKEVKIYLCEVTDLIVISKQINE